MAIAIGYNVSEANKLMDDVAKAYKDLGKAIEDEWDPIVKTMRDEWIGEDQQDFEKKLAQRLCDLYNNSYALADGCCETIVGLTQAWYDFQQSNTIDGSAAEGKGKFKPDKPNITKKDPVVKSTPKSIGANDDRGLKAESSAATIKTSVDTYVSNIKTKASTIFSDIESSKAFFGDQVTSINSYIQKVGEAIAEVVVAVKDMYDRIDALAGSQYTSSVEQVKTQFDQNATTVEGSLNDLGSSRWS